MATTPAAGNLDERLEGIIRDIRFFDEGDIKKEIEAIKQAFKDAGCMTGQEWYDKFETELNRLTQYPSIQLDMAKGAAKKAAGLED